MDRHASLQPEKAMSLQLPVSVDLGNGLERTDSLSCVVSNSFAFF